MSRFERDLRESLKRREPPEGFAESVIARARATDRPGKFSPFLRWVAVAAMVVLMVGGIALVREQRRQAENERKKEQLIAALQIMGSKLRLAQEKISVIQQRTIELHLEQ